ncbi:hypothetical protein QJS10_CPA02g00658 [Acorus calamus]|uniref:Uncharacterized protein n=1 Tax=Acorus calamus TaxID=4465 RepID=A0AAV9FH04_ACOCL|nr:hypothetical protein QJS10_CPA02g00658 [Acorus calamus]
MMGQQGMVGSESEHVLVARRKRGRPRKYSGGGGGGEMGVALSPAAAWMASSEFSPKRGKGRPPGSGQRQLLSSLGCRWKLLATSYQGKQKAVEP